MTLSTAGTSIFLTVLATYSYLNLSGFEMTHHLSWLPVISLSLVIFLASLGIVSLPFIILTELLPNKVLKSSSLSHLRFSARFALFFVVGQKCGEHNMHDFSSLVCRHRPQGVLTLSTISTELIMQWIIFCSFTRRWWQCLSFTRACGFSRLFVFSVRSLQSSSFRKPKEKV